MIYLLGGAPRSGKSTVARRFLRESQVPYFPTDTLMMGLRNGLPSLGLPAGNPRATGEVLWPVVNAMVRSLYWTRETYLLEGDLLLPQRIAALRGEIGDVVRACWLGYADIDVGEKVAQLRANPTGPNDWLRDANDEELTDLVENMRRYSQELREACAAHDFPYFDGSNDFLAAQDGAFAYLAQH